jgi:hypothetical protein
MRVLACAVLQAKALDNKDAVQEWLQELADGLQPLLQVPQSVLLQVC